MIRWSVADGRYDVTGESLEHLICKNYNQIISTDFVWSVVSKCGVCEHTFFAGELFEMDVWIFSCCSPRNHASDPSPGWLNHLSLVCQAQVVQVQRRYAMAMCKWKDGGGDGVWECGRIGFDYEDSMFHWQLKPLCLRFLYQSWVYFHSVGFSEGWFAIREWLFKQTQDPPRLIFWLKTPEVSAVFVWGMWRR